MTRLSKAKIQELLEGSRKGRKGDDTKTQLPYHKHHRM